MYLQLISIHGLIRPCNIEMGRDADTGGQIRYVLELAKSLSEHPEVDAVDLFTRRIKDKRVDAEYSEPIQDIAPNCRLVRLPCGGNRYLPKEKLWPHLDEYVDAMIAFTRAEGRLPDLVHGHYADAGYIAKEVAAAFGSPFVFTGHSLGKSKLEYLLEEGWTLEQANKTLAIEERISVEQDCLGVSDLIVTSTRHEKSSQWGLYPSRTDVNFKVIPPGTDLDRFFPYYDYDLPGAAIDERFKQARVRMSNELSRFHFEQDKPLILALCRPDRRKNIGALIEAYGRSNQLRAIANLVILAGIRNNIEEMPENERVVLTDMLLAMDRYNLYGKMAIPKNHDSEFDVPELYRLAAASGGVFVNTAFTELFGLTAIEASAVGLPFVLTDNGGPQDIAANCESGLLVDVNNHTAVTNAMLKVLTDKSAWERMSSNGVNKVREHYSWATHADRFIEEITPLITARVKGSDGEEPPAVGKRMASIERLLITDIDNTLLGDDDAMRTLCDVLHEHRDRIGFGIASGRSIELTREALAHAGIEKVDVAICSVGAEIYYGADFTPDRGWASKLRARWQRDKIEDALSSLSFLTLQERDFAQREFKISYDLDSQVDRNSALRKVREVLATTKSSYSLVFSHGTFLDVLPHRASKGKAVRYLADKWRLRIEDIATAGDSGNDLDMLQGKTAGIVVANHDAELAQLRQQKATRVYFANTAYAAGILEGLRHYSFV
ncbi:HAD-IIB family hydrolase [Botrimarina mediterranea]|uniref:HAD-IIB family hydrolase n=1 Tax=Botrimarina mediterranea TaxID=2528022 RepID=UPI00118BA075|nr:Mannosylfructose-phosphate synthase [Planctomycetes bacterium K2D]